jgi:hypothetical protein
MNRNCLRVAVRDTTLSAAKTPRNMEFGIYFAFMLIGALGIVLLVAF